MCFSIKNVIFKQIWNFEFCEIMHVTSVRADRVTNLTATSSKTSLSEHFHKSEADLNETRTFMQKK